MWSVLRRVAAGYWEDGIMSPALGHSSIGSIANNHTWTLNIPITQRHPVNPHQSACILSRLTCRDGTCSNYCVVECQARPRLLPVVLLRSTGTCRRDGSLAAISNEPKAEKAKNGAGQSIRSRRTPSCTHDVVDFSSTCVATY